MTTLPKDGTVACSSRFCPERAVPTNDPARPPFCPKCRAKWLENQVKRGPR